MIYFVINTIIGIDFPKIEFSPMTLKENTEKGYKYINDYFQEVNFMVKIRLLIRN